MRLTSLRLSSRRIALFQQGRNSKSDLTSIDSEDAAKSVFGVGLVFVLTLWMDPAGASLLCSSGKRRLVFWARLGARPGLTCALAKIRRLLNNNHRATLN